MANAIHSPAAIVTGAGSGIGRATALKLASLGYAVALAGRTRGTLDQVAREIREAGGPESMVIPTDVSKVAEVDDLVRRVRAGWSRIDVLVNNAGVARLIPTPEVSTEQWHEMLDGNLSSAFYATRAVWPIMRDQTPQGGTIVNISSMAARDPFSGLGAYAVAKAGLNMLTLATAREGDAFNIRVVGIAPGEVDTPMYRALLGAAGVDPRRVLDPADIAAAVADAVGGSLRYASGDTVYLRRRPA
jgi:NAD(P)-dependent dehydrogenase (short-subunit alcohol dehydrogenase family)